MRLNVLIIEELGNASLGALVNSTIHQPNNMMVPSSGLVLLNLQQLLVSSHIGITNRSRASFITGPCWQGSFNYTPLILQQGVVSTPSYSDQLGSVTSSDSQHQTVGNSHIYETSR